MQVVLHTGAHETDEDRLLKCLLKNKAAFSKIGVSVPGPSRYRNLIRDSMQALTENPPSEGAREILLDAILDEDTPERLIMSNEHFFGIPSMALKRGRLYPAAERKLTEFCQLFPEDDVEIFMAVRNPATFVPAIFEVSRSTDFEEFVAENDPLNLRWSEMFHRIRIAMPDIPITVWCNEDTPLIWGQLVRDISGIFPNQKIIGGFDLLYEIMSKEGMRRFRAYLASHPTMTEVQKRRVIAAFLDKFAIEDEIEQELDLPGWTEGLMDQLSDIYDEDMFELQRIPGVTFLTP